MKFTKCVFDRKLIGKINSAEMKETAAEYVKRGLEPDAAMVRTVEEKVESLKAEHGKHKEDARGSEVRLQSE